MANYSDYDTLSSPVCPECGDGVVSIWDGKLVCAACQNTETAARHLDESAATFQARLTEICQRWETTPEALSKGDGST